MTVEKDNLLMLRVALKMTDKEMDIVKRMGSKIPSPTEDSFCLAIFLALFPKFKPSLCVSLFTIISKEKPKNTGEWVNKEFENFRIHTKRIHKYLTEDLDEQMREPLGALLTEISRNNPDWSKLDRDK